MNWIPVTERLPEVRFQRCLITDGQVIVIGHYLRKHLFDLDTREYFDATHWMPLPELPTVDATLPIEPALVTDVANDTPMPKNAHEQLLTAINEHFTLDGMKIPRTF